ncbi:hypothetical protein LIER_28750 [Lithospermum erythrorhizon]|uniref:Uncharacterized protein n=1 Tax=Lithospermum erythrorhizon TaxID=34254 RepID=A0AAV3RKF4_LITER
MKNDQVLCPTPIRSLTPFNATNGVIHGEILEVHNNYLPWINYTNVLELDNPRPRMVNVEDDDPGGEKSYDEIGVKENVIREEAAPIVEERVIASSVAEMSEVVDVSGPSVRPSVEDTMSKTVELSILSDNYVVDVGMDVLEGDGVDVSHADMVPEGVEVPSTEGLGVNVNPSVDNTLNGLKDSTPSGGDVLRSSVDDSVRI